MKKSLVVLPGLFLLLLWTGAVNATLITIGNAQIGGTGPEYNLIWDDNNNGNSLVWLDYTNEGTNWSDQNKWASELVLTYNLDGYSVEWDDSSWRLPTAGGGSAYYKPNSEMRHLYYVELDEDNIYNGFFTIMGGVYWSSSAYAFNPNRSAWSFNMSSGEGCTYGQNYGGQGLAVRTGTVTKTSQNTVPEPATNLLFGLGLFGVAGMSRKKYFSFKF
jgi:hypothetical protein